MVLITETMWDGQIANRKVEVVHCLYIGIFQGLFFQGFISEMKLFGYFKG